MPLPPSSPLLPYTTLFRSIRHGTNWLLWDTGFPDRFAEQPVTTQVGTASRAKTLAAQLTEVGVKPSDVTLVAVSHTHGDQDRKSTRLNSSHLGISYAVFCL